MDRPDPGDVGILSCWDNFPNLPIGWFLLIFAIFLGFIGVRDVQQGESAGYVWGLPALFSLLTAVWNIGAVRRIRLDLGQNRVTVRRGWLIPLWGTDHELAEFEAVQLHQECPPNGVPRYVVNLIGYGDRKVRISTHGTSARARKRAQALADFLGIELIETATQLATLRASLFQGVPSLRKRVGNARAGHGRPAPTAGSLANPLFPAPPAGMQVDYYQDGARLVVEIPAPPMRKAMGRPLVAFLVLSCALALIEVSFGGPNVKHPLDWERQVRPVLMTMFAVGGVGCSVWLIFGLGGVAGLRVVAHPGGLEVTRQGWFFSDTREMPAHELVSLYVTPTAVEAMGRDLSVIRIAAGNLRTEDRDWIRDALTWAVAG